MKILKHKFLEIIPDYLEDDVLYISIQYKTVVHKCACGCGNEVVTPLTPNDWKLTFDGKTISLHPSIGNWSFACQSHYWIKNNAVKFVPKWSKDEISDGRDGDYNRKKKYFKKLFQFKKKKE